MAVTYAEFIGDAMFANVFGDVVRFPEAYAAAILAFTSTEITYCRYLNKYEMAVKLLTAHRLQMLELNGVLGTDGTATGATPASSSNALTSLIAPGSTLSSLNVAQGSNSASFSPATQTESTGSNLGGIPGATEGLASTIWGQMFSGLNPAGINVGFVS